MKEFMTKMVNVWKAWSIRTKSVVAVTLALIVFLVSSVFSTPPTPSPRFTQLHNPILVEKVIEEGGELILFGGRFNNKDKKVKVGYEDTTHRETLVAPVIARGSDDLYHETIDKGLKANRTILYEVTRRVLHSHVMQLNVVLSELLSRSDLRDHVIKFYILRATATGTDVVLEYTDGCGMIISYDYARDAYTDVTIDSKSNPDHHNNNIRILKYLNDHLDKSNK